MPKYFEFEKQKTVICLDAVCTVIVNTPPKCAVTGEKASPYISVTYLNSSLVSKVIYGSMEDLVTDYTRLKGQLLCQ